MATSLSTPVVLVIFNRPDTTQAVFDRIAAARPRQLLVVADGPRADRPGEADLCRQARQIVSAVDWPCEVLTNFSDTNLGCKRRMASGLDWVFQNVPEAIILEDDCLPHEDFFAFTQEMLERYRDDRRVMMVCGNNYMGRWKEERFSYHFSYCASIWGWATWRRAWQLYDVSMSAWADPEARNRMRDLLADETLYSKRAAVYEPCFHGKVDTWDFQWNFTRFLNSGLAIVPAVNLISNIGFRPDATHTRKHNPLVANTPTYAMQFPLKANPYIVVDREYDMAFTKKI